MSILTDNEEQATWAAGQTPPKTVDSQALAAFIDSQRVTMSSVIIKDDPYSLPLPTWVEGPFAKAYAAYIPAIGLRFNEESEDCDDFAEECKVYAKRLHNRTRPGTGLAFFDCGFNYAEYGELAEHGVCGCVAHAPGGLVLQFYFWEPQPTQFTGGFITEVLKPIRLTPAAIQSITYLVF